MGACYYITHSKLDWTEELWLSGRIYELDTHSQWRKQFSQTPQPLMCLLLCSRRRDDIVISCHSRPFSCEPATVDSWYRCHCSPRRSRSKNSTYIFHNHLMCLYSISIGASEAMCCAVAAPLCEHSIGSKPGHLGFKSFHGSSRKLGMK